MPHFCQYLRSDFPRQLGTGRPKSGNLLVHFYFFVDFVKESVFQFGPLAKGVSLWDWNDFCPFRPYGRNGIFTAAPGGVDGALLRSGSAACALRASACAASGYRQRVALSSGALSVSVGTAARNLHGAAPLCAGRAALRS